MRSIKRATPRKVEGFEMSVFELTQICDTTFTEKCYIWNFHGTPSVYFVTKFIEKLLSYQKESKNENLKKTGASHKGDIFYTDNPGKLGTILCLQVTLRFS